MWLTKIPPPSPQTLILVRKPRHLACLGLERRGIHILIVVLHDSSTQSGRVPPSPILPPPYLAPVLLPAATAKFTSPLLLPRASRASRWDSITLGPMGGESCESWRCPCWPCFHSPANDIHLLPSCPFAPRLTPPPSFIFARPLTSHTQSRLPPETSPSSPAPHLPFLLSPWFPSNYSPLILRAGGQRWMSSEPGRMSACGGWGRRRRVRERRERNEPQSNRDQ